MMTNAEEFQGKSLTEKTLGEFIAEDYRAATVFEKYGIDFFCGGQVPLEAVCRGKGLDHYALTREFEDDLHKHVHLENNILFLKAAQL